MQYDKQGNILSTSNPEAAFVFSEAIDDFLNYRTTPSARLKEALHIDPDFSLATCVRAYFLMMTESPAVLSKIQETVQELRAKYKNLTEREIIFLDLDNLIIIHFGILIMIFHIGTEIAII